MSKKILPYLKIVNKNKHRTRIASFNELHEQGKCIISKRIGMKMGRRIVKYMIVSKKKLSNPKMILRGVPIGIKLYYDIDADTYFLSDSR